MDRPIELFEVPFTDMRIQGDVDAGRDERKTRGEIIAAPDLRTRIPSSNYTQDRVSPQACRKNKRPG
jgi:hypothetical protein